MESLKVLLQKIQNERFIHHISELTYDRLSALWHLDPSVESQLSEVLSRVVTGLFFIRYLGHINDLVMEEADIKENMTSEDLSDRKKVEAMENKLSKCKRMRFLLREEILPLLREIIEDTKVTNLTDLTRLAHSGDYLCSALDDLKGRKDGEYTLWLEAVPEYYKDDLSHMDLIRRRERKGLMALEKWVRNLHQHTPVDSFLTDGKTYSSRPLTRERRRPLCGFSRWTRKSLDWRAS